MRLVRTGVLSGKGFGKVRIEKDRDSAGVNEITGLSQPPDMGSGTGLTGGFDVSNERILLKDGADHGGSLAGE
jgi:hypothetical protein